MKINSVSNQNFNGRVVFINHVNIAGKTENLRKTLTSNLYDSIKEMEILIQDKPYDLFISRSKGLTEFYQVDANTKFENVLSEDKSLRGRSSMVYEHRLDRFPTAAAEAMRSFEQVAGYKELTKPESFFKTVLNLIRGYEP